MIKCLEYCMKIITLMALTVFLLTFFFVVGMAQSPPCYNNDFSTGVIPYNCNGQNVYNTALRFNGDNIFINGKGIANAKTISDSLERYCALTCSEVDSAINYAISNIPQTCNCNFQNVLYNDDNLTVDNFIGCDGHAFGFVGVSDFPIEISSSFSVASTITGSIFRISEIGGVEMFEPVRITAPVKISDGSEGGGKIFTSDGAGNASWQPNAASSLTLRDILNNDGDACENSMIIDNIGFAHIDSFVCSVHNNVFGKSFGFLYQTYSNDGSQERDFSIIAPDTLDVGAILYMPITGNAPDTLATSVNGIKADKYGNVNLSYDSLLPYYVYTALLTQSGTGAPTATVLENTLGSISPTRSDVGKYSLNAASGTFTTNKTFVLVGSPRFVFGGVNITSAYAAGTDQVIVRTADNTGAYLDDILEATSIEIRVYK